MFIVPRDGYMTVRSHMGKLFPNFHCTNILAYLIWTINKTILLFKIKAKFSLEIVHFILEATKLTFANFNSLITSMHFLMATLILIDPHGSHAAYLQKLTYRASPPYHRSAKKLLNSVRLFPLFSPYPQKRIFLCQNSYSQNFSRSL